MLLLIMLRPEMISDSKMVPISRRQNSMALILDLSFQHQPITGFVFIALIIDEQIPKLQSPQQACQR